MGAPLLDDTLEARLCKLIKVGVDVQGACMTEMSRRTYFEWQKLAREGDERYARFFEALEMAGAQRDTRFIMLLTKAAEAGQWQAAMAQLKAHRPDLYGDRSKVEHAVNGKVAHNHSLSRDQSAEIVSKVLGVDRKLVEGKFKGALPAGEDVVETEGEDVP